jgi:glutamyl-tRNA synthetase
VIAKFLADGHAYHCYCSKEELEELRAGQLARKEKPRYDGRCRHRTEPRAGIDPVVRFRSPDEGQVVVQDIVHGPIVFEASELDDLIIARSDGTPTYNFCVVVDDYDMRVTHVIRGDDHINNTPRQMQMLRALGVEPPVYAHLPMILGPDGAKLSKRHGAVSVLQYRDMGFLPEALLNYLARLGWSHGDQEIFSIDELVQLFDIADCNKSASALNPDKMAWTNQQHIMRSTPEHLATYLAPQLQALGLPAGDMPRIAAVAKAQQERAKTLKEMAENSVFFFRDVTAYDEKAAAKNLTPATAPVLEAVRAKLAGLAEWRAPAIHEAIMAVGAEQGVGLGKVAQPVRVAVSGGTVSPPIDVTLEILGRESTLRRLERAILAARSYDARGAWRRGDPPADDRQSHPGCRNPLRFVVLVARLMPAKPLIGHGDASLARSLLDIVPRCSRRRRACQGS